MRDLGKPRSTTCGRAGARGGGGRRSGGVWEHRAALVAALLLTLALSVGALAPGAAAAGLPTPTDNNPYGLVGCKDSQPMLALCAGRIVGGVYYDAAKVDGVITEWRCVSGVAGGECDFIADDTSDSGTATITATFSPAAVKGIANLTQPDNVQALVAAMGAKNWGAAVIGSEQLIFSATLLANFKTAGVNVGWVYQRLYAQMDPGATPPPYVPSTPQAVYLSGKGPVAQPPKPAPAQAIPVVTQHPSIGTTTETVPKGTQTTQPATATVTAAPQKPSPAPQIAQAKAQEAQNAVVAVKPSPKAPAVLVPGAHIAPGWRTAQKTIEQVRAAQQRAQREDLAGVALAAVVGLFFLVQRVRHAWPFRRRAEVW